MNARESHLTIIRQCSKPLEPLPTGEVAVLQPLNNIEVVLLDVYGTLLMSSSGEIGTADLSAHTTAFRDVLNDAGLTPQFDGPDSEGVHFFVQTIEDHHRTSKAAGIDYPEVDIVEVWRTTLQALHQRGLIGGNPGEVDIAALSLKYELATNPVWPMPGAAECLTELTNRGIQLGLISNAQWFTPLLFPALLGGELDALGIGPEMQFWSWRAGRAKPDDFLFRQAADTIRSRGIEPARVLHVGNDMLNDIVPAASTGFRTALFAGDKRSLRRREEDPRVGSLQPDLVLLQLRDLLSCVRRNGDL